MDRSFELSLDIVEFTSQIEKLKKFAIANQLLKSGTSIGANVREAQSPESVADFIHKMKISAKEAQETEYWLLLCEHSEHLPNPGKLLDNVKTIQKILSSIISTSKKRL